ncbi:MAG: ion channel [Candidatus Kapaibacterium sp.]
MSKQNPDPQQEDLRDLGFGSRVSEQARLRLLNRDGSFNVARSGLSFAQRLNLYHTLLEMSWGRFILTFFATYCFINLLFTAGFLLCGPGALIGAKGITFVERFREAFFFSVDTFTTVGYGNLSPGTLAADILSMLDAFIGLSAFALATGLLFARFSRPTARIMYSHKALVAPYHGITSFQFRIANQRRSQLFQVDVNVVMTRLVIKHGHRSREYIQLPLERRNVLFFPLHLTVVHPITEQSPLYGLTPQQVAAAETEFLVQISAIDDIFSQTVHSRMSYRFDEMTWGAKFVDPFEPSDDGIVRVDMRKFHIHQPAELPVTDDSPSPDA